MDFDIWGQYISRDYMNELGDLIDELQDHISEKDKELPLDAVSRCVEVIRSLVPAFDLVKTLYMECPKDADNIPTRPGDSMVYDSTRFYADVFSYPKGRDGYAVFGQGEVLVGPNGFKLDHCHHAEPDSYRQVAEDIDNGMCSGQDAVKRMQALKGGNDESMPIL